MKVLIWILCLFANGLITTILKEGGIWLGAIPTAILFSITIWMANALCKKWDNYKKMKAGNATPYESRFTECPKCGEPLIKNSKLCGKCGTEILVEGENITSIPKCEFCDKETDHLFYCEIKDEYGTRYRNICDECVIKHGAKIHRESYAIVNQKTREIKPLYCRKCGAKLLEDSKFCIECGTEIITKVEGKSDVL